MGRSQKFLLAHLPGRVVQKTGEARPLRVQAVKFGEALGGLGHAQRMCVALVGEAFAGIALRVVEKGVVDHGGDCRIKGCKTRRRIQPKSTKN
jgi:hypothetical protein